MSDVIDVMLIENRPHAGDRAASELEAAGHRVHRCFEPGDESFPCRGLLDASLCPLNAGAEVAMLVRQGVSPHPSALEQGVHCAVRAGLPIVEDGTDLLDPFDSWVLMRVDDDPVAACVEAIHQRLEPLRRALGEMTDVVMTAVGRPDSSIAWAIEDTGSTLHLTGRGPDLDKAAKSRLAVRALDVVNGMGFERERIDVSYEGLGAA